MTGAPTSPDRPGLEAPGAVAWTVLLGSQLAVGAAALLARLGLDAGLSAPSLAAWRLGLATVLLVGVARFVSRDGSGGALPGAARLRLASAGILLGLHFATWFASLAVIPVARSMLLVATTPIWTGLLTITVQRQPVPATFWMGLAVAGAGMWLVTGGSGAGADLRGDALAVAGAVTIAGYLLLVQGDQTRYGTARVVCWTYAAAAVTMAVYVAGTAGFNGAVPATWHAWASVAGMALGPQLLGHTGINWSLRRFSAGAVAASTLVEPVFASGLAWWLLREPLTAIQAAGGSVLLAGVVLALRRGARRLDGASGIGGAV